MTSAVSRMDWIVRLLNLQTFAVFLLHLIPCQVPARLSCYLHTNFGAEILQAHKDLGGGSIQLFCNFALLFGGQLCKLLAQVSVHDVFDWEVIRPVCHVIPSTDWRVVLPHVHFKMVHEVHVLSSTQRQKGPHSAHRCRVQEHLTTSRCRLHHYLVKRIHHLPYMELYYVLNFVLSPVHVLRMCQHFATCDVLFHLLANLLW
mmetsp:Transcript_37756/g.45530  ORF Transcript_37756/g.45530 Transcript_37756/m.45530 type:complete len:202 (-) Transcript_37756:1521-2126(-)